MKPSWYELTGKLSCFGYQHGPTEAEIDRFLEGIDLNAYYNGQLLLTDMAWSGRLQTVDYLLRKGADPDLVVVPYVKGPALAHAIDSSFTKAAVKVGIVKRLLEGGANPSPAVGDRGTLLDYIIARAVDAALPHEEYAADSRRTFKVMLQGYLATIPLLIAAGGAMSDASKEALRKLSEKAGPRPLDPEKARALLVHADRDAILRLCDDHLGWEEAVAHPQWAALVRAAVDAGRSFATVAKEVYGKEVSLLDDEGWLCQSWENYVTLDLVIELLATETAVKHPEWAALMAHALQSRDAQDATDYTEDALDELFERPWVRKHPDFKKLQALLS